MLLNMSLTAPTLLEATPAEDGWPAPPPPPPPATALLPLGEVESLGLSLTWIDKKHHYVTGEKLGSAEIVAI